MYTKRIISVLFVMVLLLQVPVFSGCDNKEDATYTVKFAVNRPSSWTKFYEQFETKVKSGDKIPPPPDPPNAIVLGFGGWFQESACINSWAFYTDVVACDMVLYAKWEKRP